MGLEQIEVLHDSVVQLGVGECGEEEAGYSDQSRDCKAAIGPGTEKCWPGTD